MGSKKRPRKSLFKQQKINTAFESPFEVSAQSIADLLPDEFVAFAIALTRVEIVSYGGSPGDLLPNSAPGKDGGRDLTTNRSAPLTPGTSFVPLGETVWQLKAEKKPPSIDELANELSKPRPLSCLETGGAYTFISQQPRSDEDDINNRLREILISNGFDENKARFFASSKLAEFAKNHPSLSFLSCFNKSIEEFKPFSLWDREHKSTPYSEDVHSAEFQQLSRAIKPGRFHIAITGPTGVGKSRLALEVIRAGGLQDFIAYASKPGSGADKLIAHAINHNQKCIIIIDECDENTSLAYRERLLYSSVGLITIGADREGMANRAPNGDVFVKLKAIAPKAIERILEKNHVLSSPIRKEIAARTGGYIKLAKLIADEIVADPTIGQKPDSWNKITIVEHALTRMIGTDKRRLSLIKILACFSRIEHNAKSTSSELYTLSQEASLPFSDTEETCAALRKEGLIADTGSYYYVTPDLLSQWLMESYIESHRESFSNLIQRMPQPLMRAHSRQLERLRGSETGKLWVQNSLESDGPFSNLLLLRQQWADEVLMALASAAPNNVATYVANWASKNTDAAIRIAHSAALRHLLFRAIRQKEGFKQLFSVLLDSYEAANQPSDGALWDLLEGVLICSPLSTTLTPYPVVLRHVQQELRRRSASTKEKIILALANGLLATSGQAYSEFDRLPEDRWREETSYKDLESAISLLESALEDVDTREVVSDFIVQNLRQLVTFRGLTRFFELSVKALEISRDINALTNELRSIVKWDNPSPADVAKIETLIANFLGELNSRIRLVAGGWPIDDEIDLSSFHPTASSVALEIISLPEPQQQEIMNSLFEPWAKNAESLLVELAKTDAKLNIWKIVLNNSRNNDNSWLAAIFLATTRNSNAEVSPTAYSLLQSHDSFNIDTAAQALSMSSCAEDEIALLAARISRAEISNRLLSGMLLGRWNEKQPRKGIEVLISAMVENGSTAHLAVGLTYRELESKREMPLKLQIRVLVSGLTHVDGHLLWVWEQLGAKVARQAPKELALSLIGAIRRDVKVDADSELSKVLLICLRQDTTIAEEILSLWEFQKYLLIHHFAELFIHLDVELLKKWVGTNSEKERALGRIVPATDFPLTISLLEHFGDESVFASALSNSAASGTWSGNLSKMFESRALVWQQYAASAISSSAFKRFAESLTDWFRKRAEAQRVEEADEEANFR
jgi:hypothetical protein